MGHDVVVVDMLWFGNHLRPEIPVIECDIRAIEKRDFEGFDQVIYLAGLSNDPMADYDPLANFEANASVPAHLCRLARLSGVKRFIHGGSCSVYGYSDAFFTENDLPKSQTPYGVSKLMAELGCLQQADDRFSVINFRQGTVVGYSPRMRFDLVVNRMVLDSMIRGRITVDDPAAWRPLLVIEDAIRAYAMAVRASSDISGTYNIASANYTIDDIARCVRDAVRERGLPAPEIVSSNKKEHRSYRVHMHDAARDLDYEPLYRATDAARSIIAGFDQWADDPLNPIYYNIERFKILQRLPGALRKFGLDRQKTAEIVAPLFPVGAPPQIAEPLPDSLH
jgi:nucleoside-diphosphate-sugar epimerase